MVAKYVGTNSEQDNYIIDTRRLARIQHRFSGRSGNAS
jgi:hypothetical protein